MTNQLRILVAEDDPQMQLAIKATLSRAGHQVTICGDGTKALQAFDENEFEVIVSDQRMPELTGSELLTILKERGSKVPFVMITAHGTINQAVEAMQLGAADFLTKPFSSEDLVRIVERVSCPELHAELNSQEEDKKGRPIVTNDSRMIRILEVAEAVARSDATVLVQGESGTGKELIARLVHASSARSKQPFIAVNCAALPANLLESELFGHEKGAFTGAQGRKIGKFELAQGGTILLDEISEMELALQAKLLRVLQEREVDRVGGQEPIPLDVRVIATTNRNLLESVEAGDFRADLYYRLNVIPLTLPPLRERKKDILLLSEFFMRQFLGEKAPALPEAVERALVEHSWPGNVRELQNAVERAAILARGGTPRASDFLLSPIKSGATSGGLAQQIEIERVGDEPSESSEIIREKELTIRSGLTVHEMEKTLILETLRSTNQNRTKAAELLGISVRTLRNKLNEYGEGK